MRPRRRFCIARRLLVTVGVIGSTLVSTITRSSAFAQTFVTCEAYGSHHSAREFEDSHWLRDGEDILHAFAGDDLQAYFGFHPRIQLIERSAPNAFAVAPGAIVVSSGLIDITASSSEYAFILAHELGHLVLEQGNDFHSLAATHSGDESRLAEEFAADAYALRLLKDRGFDPAAGVAVLKKVVESTERAGGAPERLFPSINSRILAMTGATTPPRS